MRVFPIATNAHTTAQKRRAGRLRRHPHVVGLCAVFVLVLGSAASARTAVDPTARPGVDTVARTLAVRGSAMALERFSDFKDTVWTETFLNRWRVPPSKNWTGLGYVGERWPDGSGIFEQRTPYGLGFRFVQNEEVSRGSGAGVMIADVDHILDQQNYLGTVTDLSGKVMFPKAGNPRRFPRFGDWNVLWEFSQSDAVYNLFGIDAVVHAGPRFYVRSFDAANPENRNGRKARSRFPVRFDHWYTWRWQIRWSDGGDGFVNFWVNGQRIAAWTGPTLPPNSDAPYIELGWYGGFEPGRNEVRFAALRALSL